MILNISITILRAKSMVNDFNPPLLYIVVILLLACFIISHFISNRWIWVAVVCGFIAGFLGGIYRYGFPDGLVSGFIIGILFNLLSIPFGLLAKYYRSKSQERLKRNRF